MSEAQQSVLLCDDEATIVRVCGELLAKSGYEVTTAATGFEALRRIGERRFDCTVIDLVLPDINGLDVLAAIREADPEAVVILMTGHASLETAVAAVRQGAYDYLRKPFSSSDLLRVVQRGLKQHQLSLKNRHLYRELDEANRELQRKVELASEELAAFIDLGKRLNGHAGPRAALDDIVQCAMQLTAAATGAILATSSPAGYVVVAAAGAAAEALQRIVAPADEYLIAQALATGEPVVAPDLIENGKTAAGPFALLGLRSALVLPLTVTSRTVGVMGLWDPAQPFTDRQVGLVRMVVRQAAEILDRYDCMPQNDASAANDDFIDLGDILNSNAR